LKAAEKADMLKEYKRKQHMKETEEPTMCLYGFLACFTADTRVTVLDENGTVLDENTIGEITQRIMNRRTVISSYIKMDQLMVITALDKERG